jgi:hypothetical protein
MYNLLAATQPQGGTNLASAANRPRSQYGEGEIRVVILRESADQTADF